MKSSQSMREKLREILEQAQCNPDMMIWAEKDILQLLRDELPEKTITSFKDKGIVEAYTEGWNAYREAMEEMLRCINQN